MSIIPIDLLLSPYLNVTQSTPTNPTQTNESGVPKFKKYYPVPPPQPSVYLYQNVNHDVNLRKNVTEFFHTKVLKWINMSYPGFTEHKSKLKMLDSTDGKMIIYNLLRDFIKKSGINWYDLRDNYSLIKEYLSKKL